MLKLIIQQEKITNYRIELFNLLSKNYNLTVVHGGPKLNSRLINFKQMIKKCYKFGPFLYQNFFDVVKDQDILITEANLRYFFNNIALAFFSRNFKWISWGIGVSASYKKKYDKDRKYDFLRYLIFGRSNALLFYSKYPIRKYKTAGIKAQKLFVAHNTFPNNCKFNKKRKHFVFVGSLICGKGLMELLYEYKLALKMIGTDLPPLLIIGEGEMQNKLKDFIQNESLEKKIQLLGPIYENKKLNKILRCAYLSISPNQVGLALLHSMSCGVAFVTSKKATTGGEIFNINKSNGILLNKKNRLRDIFVDTYKNPKKYVQLGKNAHKYYYKNRTITKMLDGFLMAIKYVTKN